ncbi:hypothetical protein ACI6QG_02710 [Roseococcus sp. DSY-14]|uniref:hypothetical protein n=1 Tax=Roseococcus sp. DSY-14 TaxID=3369650 RepID=UPI00387B352A
MSGAVRRFGWRVWFLPVFLWPLGLDLLIELFRAHPRGLLGAALGLGLAVLAARRLASGRHGSKRAGAVLMGVSAGLTALLAAHLNPVAAVLLAFGAWLGTRLLTDDLPEAAPEPPPPPRPAEDALAAIRAQVSRSRLAAPSLPEGARIAGAAGALEAVLADLDRRPRRVPEARRSLALQADGLARIVERLEAGARPPPSLPALLDDMRAATERLRDDLSAAESEALDIQVKVLAERLRQEGP